ncbi:glycerophosphoryl diester phosphodiesterase membrane domain-containing protein [Streptomyces sp. NPDC056721]|uniref:glycerophosphoryl diester phosphodiesterase membrane domain-containing protein n=1 Tax=unclassified Streptomyces TaxID=2593676 RepID=UPI0036C07F18
MNDTPGWASPGSAPSDGQDDQPEQDGQDGRTGDGEDAAPDPKWSKEQPPPAQWSAPSGTGRTPPPPSPPAQGWGGGSPGGPAGPGGYGGGGGYGGPGGGYGAGWGSWQGRPPAAKPGVIPLRPLGVGEILDGAVSTMRAHWRTVLGISLSVAVLIEIVVVLLQGLVLNNSTNTDALDDPSATASELTRAVGDTLLSSGVVQIVYLLGTIVATALLTTVTSRAVLGKSVTTGEAWKDAKPQLLKLAGLTLLLPLIAAAVLFVCMLPGILVAALSSSDSGAPLIALGALGGAVLAIWLMIRFSLASPALMLEKQSILKSMSRSAKLVRGSWWRVFGIQLLAGIIAGLVSSIIVIPFTFLAAALGGEGVSGLLDGGTGDLGWTFLIVTGVGSVIGSMLTFPITAGVTVLLYIDQRIRREALDLELGRAAGLQGYGDTTSPTPGS